MKIATTKHLSLAMLIAGVLVSFSQAAAAWTELDPVGDLRLSLETTSPEETTGWTNVIVTLPRYQANGTSWTKRASGSSAPALAMRIGVRAWSGQTQDYPFGYIGFEQRW